VAVSVLLTVYGTEKNGAEFVDELGDDREDDKER
jgi:hypothetical protein